jgi:uncharacterized protein YjbI with pentapeptide repeats
LRWTGLRGKTLWDWQALLFIPVTIALIASLFTQIQNSRQREMDNLRAEQDKEQSYLEDMGSFLLEENLRKTDESEDVRLLARARTLSVLDGVSGHRKVRVLEFLAETQLIHFGDHNQSPVISLKFANLSDTPLVRRSILSNTDLDRADLTDTKLADAKLIDTRLTRADLSGADLRGSDLSGADLSRANLRDAIGVSCRQTEPAESFKDATMPDGQKYEDWLKDKDNC